MSQITFVEYDDFIDKISNKSINWSIIAGINFEERSLTLLKNILSKTTKSKSHFIRFFLFKLVSKSASSFSALEIVKERFEEQLRDLAKSKGISMGVRELEYPVKHDMTFELLSAAQGNNSSPSNLILDLSSLPREMAVFLCDLLCGLSKLSKFINFHEIYIVLTPPERIIGRKGLGPFSVGAARGLYNPEIFRKYPEDLKISLLVFPGEEGFEAKAAVDELYGHNAIISVAMSCFDISLNECMNSMIANQSLLSDEINGVLTVQYCYSELDALRIADEFTDRAVNICEEHIKYRHAFLVAPFGPKWSILIASIARTFFQQRCAKRAPEARVLDDVLLIPTSQYLSLYSRGSSIPRIYQIK